MPDRKGAWIGVSLLAGTLLVLAGPVYLLWNTYRVRPWDAHTVKVRFEAVRYEGVGYVFTYRLDNRTHRRLYLRPEWIQIKPVQEGNLPPSGFAGLVAAIDVAAGESQEIELRFALPLTPAPSGLAQQIIRPGADAPVSPLPMRDPPKEAEAAPAPEFSLRRPLEELNGFEIVDESRNVHLLLPRAW
jgi:hypothetical protein